MSADDHGNRFGPLDHRYVQQRSEAFKFKRTTIECPECHSIVTALRDGKCLRCGGWVCECGRPKTPDMKRCRFADRDPQSHKPEKPRVLPYDSVARRRP